MGKPDKRRKYADAFTAEALRLTGNSRSARATARQPASSERLPHRWQQQAAAERGSAELARTPDVRALPAELQQGQRARDLLKNAVAIFRRAPP